MKSIIGKALTVGLIAFVVSFLATLLVSDAEYALFLSPAVALLAAVPTFVMSFEKYGYNRINADNPIDSVEIDRWIMNSLFISVPLLALFAGSFMRAVSTGEASYLPFVNLMVFGVLLLVAVIGSIIHLATRHVESIKSRISNVSFIQKFNHWLDVKA